MSPPADHARIDALQRQAAARPDTIAFCGGLPAARLFPREALATLSARVLAQKGESILQYGWPEGDETLRTWIADRLQRRGAKVAAADVTITSGAQQAINLTAELLGSRCRTVSIDAVTYPGALSAFRQHAVPLVAHGDAQACNAYLMPGMHNPLGQALTEPERQRFLASGLTLIEGDAYADLHFAGPPPALLGLAPERVWHIGTFSKTIGPGLRLGWLVVPKAQRAALLDLKGASDIQSSGLAQAMLSEFLPRDDFDARLALARRYYADQAQRLMTALRRHLPEWRFQAPQGGFSLWVETPAAGPSVELLAAAVRHGVAFDPGESFRAFAAPGLALRLCYSNAPPEAIPEGVRRLAAAWREVRRTQQAA